MHIPSSSDRRAGGANMTPMIDVVFLLIIFFLVSSHLARQENRLPLDLPVASTFDRNDPQRAPLTISVDAAGEWLVRGDVVDIDALQAALNRYRAKAGSSAAVRIRSEGTIQYRFVEPLVLYLLKNKVVANPFFFL